MSIRRTLCLIVLLVFGFASVWAEEGKPKEKSEFGDFVKIVKLKEGRLYDEVIASCGQFLERYPSSIAEESVRSNLAQSLYYKRAYNSAIKEFTSLVEKYADSVLLGQSCMLRGESFRSTRKYRESIPDFRRACGILKEAGDASAAAHALYHVGQAYRSGL